jgi:hypothetical protein
MIPKYTLAKAGDKITFEVMVQIKDGYNYQKGTIYDGHVIQHYDSATDVEFVGDDGSIVKVTVYHKDGAENFELIISDDEFEKRKVEWLDNAIEIAKKNAEEAFLKQVNYLKSVDFK